MKQSSWRRPTKRVRRTHKHKLISDSRAQAQHLTFLQAAVRLNNRWFNDSLSLPLRFVICCCLEHLALAERQRKVRWKEDGRE